MTKISCIIPTCDRNEYLIQAIKSVLEQSTPPMEVIIVNNGKKSVYLPPDVKEKIRIFDIIPYAGVSQARNFGASVAQGDYLAFLDDDDLWNKKYLENVHKVLLDKNIFCTVSRLDKLENGKILFYKNPNGRISIENLLFFNPGITGSNIVISKKLFFKIGGFDVNLPTSEDKSLLIEILKMGEKIEVLADNFAIRRIHAGTKLTNALWMAEGIHRFTLKYSDLMTKRQYLLNWSKIFKYRYESGNKLAGFQYIFVQALSIFIKLFKIN